jgi:hypothetical protein
VGSLEVVALLDLLAHLVDGIVDLLHIDFGNDVETGHELSSGNGCFGAVMDRDENLAEKIEIVVA